MALTGRDYAVPEFDKASTLACAITYLAAGIHSKSAGEQQQLAATFWEDCLTNFEGVDIEGPMREVLLEMIAKASKPK